ncbi:SusC/RagA family TonB-linked outer membrane protein [Aquirufa sp. ROCK2-A2]
MKVQFKIVCCCVFLVLLVTNVFAQSLSVKGTITNKETGEKLIGATISIDGTSKAATSNEKGEFSISASKNAVLTITHVGMLPFKYTLKNSSNLDIALEESNKDLNEVVVIGYGSQKRKNLSTSISSISAKEVAATPVADAAQALQGRVAGVTIVQGSGAPGGTGGTSIKIRGISSLTGTNNPLIVVDGYPLPDQGADNILNSFGTGDIESIDVLKDAAAASIYGVRASNGVILITTKRGKSGKANINIDMYTGLQEAWQLPSMLNAREYAVINTEARIASGLEPISKLKDANAIEGIYGKGFDWLNQTFRKAAIHNINMTATGGSDKASYLLSAGYFKQDGIIDQTNVERFNLRFNGDIQANRWLKIGNSLSMNRLIEHSADTYSPFNSVILLALMAPPTVSSTNLDGTWAGGNGSLDGFNEPNPIYQLYVPKNEFTKYRINGNIFAEATFLKDFKFKVLLGGDFNYYNRTSFNPATPSTGGRPISISGYSVQNGLNPDYLAEFTLAYDHTFAQDHHVNVVGGYTFQENQYSFLLAGRGGNFAQSIPALNDIVFRPTDISQTYNASENGVSSRLISYFARVNYDFNNKYYAGFSIRRDGSSNFAPANKFAVFPSFSAAWRINQEDFMSDVSWISDLKLRASYGFTGNPNVAGFAYLQSVNQSFQYTFGNSTSSGGIVGGAAPSKSYNPDIKWEKNEQLNIGLDGTLWNGKLGFALDVYQRRSKDLILYVAPPYLSGTYEAVPFNTGTLQNRGIDISLNSKIVNSNKFIWTISAIASTYQNEVISLGLSAPLDGSFARITGGSLRTTQGMPASYFFGFVTDGIFQSYDEIKNHAVQTAGTNPATSTAPGDIRFKDLNNDGVINDKDRTNIGNANPNFTYGLTNTLSYKNFDLTVFIQGSAGNKVLNFTRWYTEGGVSNGNYSKEAINRWTGPGSSNSMPRMTLNDPNGNNRVSDRFVEDASYVRLKNVRLAYNLPSAIANRFKFNKATFYVSAQNVFTYTKYTGMDPEVGGGVDIGFYPQARTFTAGLNFDF